MTNRKRLVITLLVCAGPLAIFYTIANLWIWDDESVGGKVFLNSLTGFALALGIVIGIYRGWKGSQT